MSKFFIGALIGAMVGVMIGLDSGKTAVLDLQNTSIAAIRKVQEESDEKWTLGQKEGFAIGRMAMATCMKKMVVDHVNNDEHCSEDFANFPKWQAEASQ